MDGWSALLLVIWMVAYIAFIRFFMPRVRRMSMKRAAARAMVTGQVVDTVTNIKTVKLFAHDRHEDQAANADPSACPYPRLLAFGCARKKDVADAPLEALIVTELGGKKPKSGQDSAASASAAAVETPEYKRTRSD